MPGEAIAEAYDAFEKGKTLSPLATAAVSNQTIQESMRLVLLVRAFQVREQQQQGVAAAAWGSAAQACSGEMNREAAGGSSEECCTPPWAHSRGQQYAPTAPPAR